jgi:hypothetical protein
MLPITLSVCALMTTLVVQSACLLVVNGAANKDEVSDAHEAVIGGVDLHIGRHSRFEIAEERPSWCLVN